MYRKNLRLRYIPIIILFLFFSGLVIGQNSDKGNFSGGFVTNGNIFLRDSLIGASGIPQYDNELFGAESWFNLNYTRSGYTFRVRYDMFSNSNLLNPTDSYTADGIGYWLVDKQLDKLGISAGYIYDQIGSGIIYRAFEQRPQLIDNALRGARVTYSFNDDWNAKLFVGRQKSQLDIGEGTIKGASVEGFVKVGKEKAIVTLAPGFGLLNRTHSDATVSKLVNIAKNIPIEERPDLMYNVYMFSAFNTLTAGRFNLYTEAAYKTPDAFRNIDGDLVSESGTVLYGSLGYAQKGLGVTIEGKRTENFDVRTDPTLQLNRGLLNFIPPMNRLNTYRLTSRYSPATQMQSEQAFQVDLRYAPKKKLNFYLNYSKITDLESTELYQEVYFNTQYKLNRTWQFIVGLQLQEYNQFVYEVKPGAPMVETITPFVDILYKISRKKSIRLESQYMATDQDYGSWMYGLVELGLAPHWSFEISAMYNSKPGKNSPKDTETGEGLKLLYPTAGAVYTHKSNRYSIRYVKQIEGVVCSGGICRLEPAFSGIRMNVTSTF